MPNLRTSGKRNLAEGLDVCAPDRPKAVAKGGSMQRAKAGMRQKEKLLDNRLMEWGEWRARPIHALGYKTESPESRANQDGRKKTTTKPHMRCKETVTFRPRDPKYNGARDDVLEVEQCFQAVTNSEWRLVLVARYVAGYQGRDGASACDCSEKTYYDRLAQVRAFMMGWLRI